VAAISSFYETEPVEAPAQPWFLNCAIALETPKTPAELMASILRIEQGMGRKREQKKGPRTIDIDILLFGKAVIATPKLTVPHPAMQERRFVLEPLAEIRPEALHPQFNKTVLELLQALPPGQEVRRKIQPGISTD
jgi:2-amino-4-hydroxy-6-hydroxymethyldihydropteridine diphosphokinase